ncbi:hypothetical protein P4393_11855 [Bacillus subtilis]|nr:hypothetical protein [Bacillus subtilis]MED3474693.1 hypothetical protein [Bacillus subtilis]
MVIQKARHNYHDGTGFKTLHYETQAGQVVVLDSNGDPSSNLDETLLTGKLIESADANLIKTTGIYRVKGGVNFPSGMDQNKIYMMFVIAVNNESGKTMVRQEFYDHVNLNMHERSIDGDIVKPWLNAGKSTLDRITAVENDIVKIYDEITTMKNNINSNKDAITQNKASITDLSNKLSTHNHDSRYLKLTGGNLSGSPVVNNDVSFSGKNTSGAEFNLAKIDKENIVVLGHSGTRMVLEASAGDIYARDESGMANSIWHSGNMGSGSGLDADKLDGINGNQFARRDATNDFTQDQGIHEGKSLFIKAQSGSSQAGSVFFQDGSGNQKARIKPLTDGTLQFHGGTTVGLEVRPDGDTYTWHDHILNAKDRQVALRFKLNDSDKGAGFYMNNGSKQVGFYDWEYGGRLFSSDREDQMVKFDNAIKIQGHQLSIQGSAPSGASDGDIWIDI